MVDIRYGFSLDKDLVEKEDNKYVVYILGEKYLIENRNVEFDHTSLELLTTDEFLELIKGTKGVIDIKGKFKE